MKNTAGICTTTNLHLELNFREFHTDAKMSGDCFFASFKNSKVLITSASSK